ncbi:MAG: DUF4148 domain-containing protein [Chitinophagaceae bacterium]|nr:DUF4148 domain-containing protein [Rubrivivax sp.]
MNAKTLLSTTVATAFAAFAFIAATPALAEARADQPTAKLTRAEVKQQLRQARAEGRIVEGEQSYVAEPVGMAKTRAQVRAETLEAVRVGAIGYGEQSVFPTFAQLQSIELAGLKALSTHVAAR